MSLSEYLNSTKVKKILSRKPGEEGFSLVELVIVIAVLAILAAVAIPSFQGVQNRAKISAVKNGLVNGIKECVVSSGLGEGTLFANARALNEGKYTGYDIERFGGSDGPDSCYQAQAAAKTGEDLPWIRISYDPTTGVSTKTCDKGTGDKYVKKGCDENGNW